MMKNGKRNAVLIGIAVAIFCGVLWATTWVTETVACPLCHQKNEFSAIASYGTYIYGWPSKFQGIYWPSTDGHVVYTCKKCKLSLFMWDYEKLPADKMEAVRKALQGTSIAGNYRHYYEMPMSVRLDIAEKVYSVLDKDYDFWAHFYRVKGYHLAVEKKTAEADAARTKAREYIRKLIDDPANASKRKELLINSASMSHFLRDGATAKSELEQAKNATYHDDKKNADENRQINDNINAFISEYLTAIAENKVPKDDGTDRQ